MLSFVFFQELDEKIETTLVCMVNMELSLAVGSHSSITKLKAALQALSKGKACLTVLLYAH